MEICINYGGHVHCFVIPVVEVPVRWPHPGPGPVNYPQMFQDGMILASIQNLAQHVADANVKQSLHEGLAAATRAMQQHAGEHVTIRQGAAAKA